MSHEINQPFDRVFSTQSVEWHGLAEVCDKINTETVRPLLFPIRTGKIMVAIDDKSVEMGNHKALVADLRGREDINEEDRLQPLHIPKNSYEVIENEVMWSTIEKIVQEFGLKVTSAGTIGTCKKFFVSMDMPTGNDFEVERSGGVKDKYYANFNMVTSHDGTIALNAFDSMVRQICQNTVRAALDGDSNFKFKIYHSSGANLAINNFEQIIKGVLAGREQFKENAYYLLTQPCTSLQAYNIIIGFLLSHGNLKNARDNQALSSRVINSGNEIARLFLRGLGNSGNSLYDLLNGATEYWTLGEGTGKGKNVSMAVRVSKANFGTAADYKEALANTLLNPNTVSEYLEIGKESASWRQGKGE